MYLKGASITELQFLKNFSAEKKKRHKLIVIELGLRYFVMVGHVKLP